MNHDPRTEARFERAEELERKREARQRIRDAAPELLEALEKAEKLIADLNYAYYVKGTRKALDAVMGETKPTLKPIRAAIAKAKGE